MKKNRIQAALIAFLLIGSILLLSACGGKKPIRIGVFEPLSGNYAANGYAEKEGIELAYALRPTLDDREIELVLADNQSDLQIATNIAQRLATEEKVCAVIGSWGSTLSSAGGKVFQEEELLAITASGTDPAVTFDNPWYYRMCFIDSFQGRALARYALTRLNAHKVAIVTEDDNQYSVSLARYFSEALLEYSGDSNIIVCNQSYPAGTQDFNTLITAVNKTDPDLIFAPGSAKSSALLIKQSRQLGLNATYLGGDTWANNEFLQIGGSDLQNVVLSSYFDSTVALTQQTLPFVEAYRTAYGADKTPADITALAFDAYNILYDAIQIAGSTDSEKIRDALSQMKNWEGVAGHYNFDGNGDASKDVIFKTVNNGSFQFLEAFSNTSASDTTSAAAEASETPATDSSAAVNPAA